MKITIEINGKTETFAGKWKNQTLLEVFQELGITQVHAPCGGNGTCKKCLVKVNGEYVLSCQTMCEDGMMVVLEAEQKAVIAETGDCYLYPADQTNRLVAACDIGTTTVVCHLLDGKTGVRLSTVWGGCNFTYSGGKRLRFAENGVCNHESDQSDAWRADAKSKTGRQSRSVSGGRKYGDGASVLRTVPGKHRCRAF